MADLDGRGSGESAGWSTFEARMRRRRFERCVTTAREALASGELDRSKSALEEARALFPDAEEIPALEARLTAPAQPVVVAPPVEPPPVVKPPAVTPPVAKPAVVAPSVVQPPVVEAPVVKPPAVKPPVVKAPVVQAPIVKAPVVKRPAVPPRVVEPLRAEAPYEPELLLRPQPEATLFSSSSYQPPSEPAQRRVMPILIAIAAIGLFAVGGFMATQFYLERPERQAQLATSDEPLPARDTTPAPSTARVEPRQEPTRGEPAPEQPPRPEPAPEVSEPVRAEPTRPAPALAEPARADATRAEPTRGEPVRAIGDRNIDAPMSRLPASRDVTPTTNAKPAPSVPPPPPDRPASVAPVDPLPAVADRPATSTTPSAITPTTGSTASAPAPVASTPPPAATPAVETPTEAPRPPARPASQTDEPLIRAVLARYETAYNRLDATAASSVYPGVNREALGRAFGGLLSQKVSLGLCDITVIGDIGGASCVGKARWEPKVGGGARTADRRWTFSLRRGADGWRIEQVVVR
jgi:hypothetical protein